MNRHRIRMTELEGDPVPVLWIEIEKDSWIDVSIDINDDMDNLHTMLHEYFNPIFEHKIGSGIPLTYDTRAFNLYEGMRGYQEEIIR